LVNLFLPSIWSEENIKDIQKNLLSLLCKHFIIDESDIFIMTLLIQSGHLIEKGNAWTVNEYYTLKLIKQNDKWKINYMKLTATYEEGNIGLLAIATKLI
jgi:hypothetical protein